MPTLYTDYTLTATLECYALFERLSQQQAEHVAYLYSDDGFFDWFYEID